MAMFSKLSKEYVDLQSQHERAKEELNHQECKRQKVRSLVPMYVCCMHVKLR